MAIDEVSYVDVTSPSLLVHEVGGGTSRETRTPPATGGSPLSWFQERLWIHALRDSENTSYNLPLLLLVEGELDAAALEQSLTEIVTRHESLRTTYGQTPKGEPVQFVAPPGRVQL